MKYLLTILLWVGCWFGIHAQGVIEGISSPGSLYIGRPAAPSFLVTREPAFSDEDGNNFIDAEESTKLTFILRNQGKGDAVGLKLLVSEKNNATGLVFDRENALGNLAPAKEMRVTIPVKGSMKNVNGTASFRLEVREAFGFDADPIEIQVPVRAFQNPQLAVADHAFSNESGGAMTLGIPLSLTVLIQNTGKGDARSVTADFSVPAEVYPMGETHFNLGTMASGESKKVVFELVANKRYAAAEVPVKLITSESFGKYGLSQTLSVKINQQLASTTQVVVKGISQPSGTITPGKLDRPAEPTTLDDYGDIHQKLPRSIMPRPDDIAVIFGNSAYQKTKPVDFATNDALWIKNYLVQSLGFREGNVFVEQNAIKSTFELYFGTKGNPRGKLYNAVKPGKSAVFIFYSGHGAPGLKDQQSYFLPVETDPNYVELGGYDTGLFYENLAQIPALTKMVILDACFSGANIFSNISLVRISNNASAGRDPGLAVLSSSSGTEVSSWYNARQHGLFTWFFLRAIHDCQRADKNKDRQLTLAEVHAYISDQSEGIPYYARRLHGIDQHPVMQGQNQDIVIMSW
ncbi:MAG: caspase family protein [Bacteroidia bacterium]